MSTKLLKFLSIFISIGLVTICLPHSALAANVPNNQLYLAPATRIENTYRNFYIIKDVLVITDDINDSCPEMDDYFVPLLVRDGTLTRSGVYTRITTTTRTETYNILCSSCGALRRTGTVSVTDRNVSGFAEGYVDEYKTTAFVLHNTYNRHLLRIEEYDKSFGGVEEPYTGRVDIVTNGTPATCAICHSSIQEQVPSVARTYRRFPVNLYPSGRDFTNVFKDPGNMVFVFDNINFDTCRAWIEGLALDPISDDYSANTVVFRNNCTGTIDVGDSLMKNVVIMDSPNLKFRGDNNGLTYFVDYRGTWYTPYEFEGNTVGIDYTNAPNFTSTSLVLTKGKAIRDHRSVSKVIDVSAAQRNYYLDVNTFPGLSNDKIPLTGGLWVQAQQTFPISLSPTIASYKLRTTNTIAIQSGVLSANTELVAGKTLTLNGTSVNGPKLTASSDLSAMAIVDNSKYPATITGKTINISGWSAPNSSVTIKSTSALPDTESKISKLTANILNLSTSNSNLELTATINSEGSTLTAANASSNITVKSSTFKGSLTTSGVGEVIIDGGNYTGSPAVTGNNVERSNRKMSATIIIILITIIVIMSIVTRIINWISCKNVKARIIEEATSNKTANKKAEGIKPSASQSRQYHRCNSANCSLRRIFYHPLLPRPP